MAMGFSGYSEDMETYTGTLTQWIAYHNQQATMLHAIGKLSMPAVPMDWQQNINPYLYVDFIQTMFYGYSSSFESPSAAAWWQENFGQYGRNTPPASPLILGIINMPPNTYPLSWQLSQATNLKNTYGAPNLAGFALYNYEYMGSPNPDDWTQWNNWITNFTK
jgi:hypothetical protein